MVSVTPKPRYSPNADIQTSSTRRDTTQKKHRIRIPKPEEAGIITKIILKAP